MIHPFDPTLRRYDAVRDGRAAPVTCSACGCRLDLSETSTGVAWAHFNPIAGRDARGCVVACADASHSADGQPVS
jgi:hypothetical protein